MKLNKNLSLLSSLILLLLLILSSSCSFWNSDETDDTLDNESPPKMTSMMDDNDAPLPVQYQKPSYMVDMQTQEDLDLDADDVTLKVGAKIQSTVGPQPLVAILKQLASLKSMNVSWASDVDQNVLVDVDISANDDFFMAIDNLLRQVDYFHEINGSTIIVKYRETKQYHIAMPFTKQTYETGTGGNVLGSEETAANIEGTIRLDSKGNEFNMWETIEKNLQTILAAWSTEAVSSSSGGSGTPGEAVAAAADGEEPSGPSAANATRQRSGSDNVYLIDKPVGIITVTGPRPLQEKVEQYFNNLKNSIYRQISIEAKIIEVQLTDNSSIGINWSQVLKNFNLSGSVEFGSGGQIWPFIFSNNSKWNDGTNHGKTYDPSNFVSKVSLNTANFNVFLNALKEQGDTKVLSNPKIAVLNGQPALITVGRNVTYIDSIESELDSDTGLITYTANTERILSGVGLALTATILGDSEIVMNLVPVTSELEEPIEYEDIGTLGGKIGLPVINVREISSTVRVKDGEMLVLGGLITKNKDTQGEFFPLLGSIPIVRYLFGYEEKIKEKRELIILLRPRII